MKTPLHSFFIYPLQPKGVEEWSEGAESRLRGLISLSSATKVLIHEIMDQSLFVVSIFTPYVEKVLSGRVEKLVCP